jgi:hypothetical protein
MSWCWKLMRRWDMKWQVLWYGVHISVSICAACLLCGLEPQSRHWQSVPSHDPPWTHTGDKNDTSTSIKSYTQYTQYTCNSATYCIRSYMHSIYNNTTMFNEWGALMMIGLDRNMLANLWTVLHNKECAFVGYIELLLLLLWKCTEQHI